MTREWSPRGYHGSGRDDSRKPRRERDPRRRDDSRQDADRHDVARRRQDGRRGGERRAGDRRDGGRRDAGGGRRGGDRRGSRRRDDSRDNRRDSRARNRRTDRRRDAGRRQDSRSRSRSSRGNRRQQQQQQKEEARQQAKKRACSTSQSSKYSSDTDDSRGSDSDKKKSADSDKDEIVHFSWHAGLELNNRYRTVCLLGDGTFGRVLLATDGRQGHREVAVKVIRDIDRYAENAKIEAKILEDIKKEDPTGEKSRSAVMYETFWHGRHYCLVFEPCGSSLYDFLKANSFRGFWLQDIQHMALQSLEALAFLHEKMKMTHTDLKPENILLETMKEPRQADFPRASSWRPPSKSGRVDPYRRPCSSAIRLIDFGNATYADEHHSSIINTRQYRGPEVILGNGWDEKSDVWSMGCILMELYSGELLFGTHENFEHLALMEKTLEPIPVSMLRKGENRDKYVVKSRSTGALRLGWPEGAQSEDSKVHVERQVHLSQQGYSRGHKPFTDFVGALLTLDPSLRPSASEALRHPFLGLRFDD